jgi:cysteine-rich repeat protein
MTRTCPWLALILVFAACGDNKSPATPPDGGSISSQSVCGNFIPEPGEDCDTGAVDGPVCTADCHSTCGNGVVDTMFGETCDNGITSGAGRCPTTCDDADACTTDTLSGTDCTRECIHDPITQPHDGDGCCPSGANANNDSDCTAVCGNGVVETGEQCDTAIAAGMPGACPSSCDDTQACTIDTLVGAMCQATCTHTTITMPANNDGCCPTGANSGNDNDCPASCGNGVVDAGETCDTAIAPGMPGACPTSCSDTNACTTDVLDSGGTCLAACAFVPITMPINGDGCCPAGANANDDNDCHPVCGNGVVEMGEQCDDGNTNNNDACTNTCTFGPTAFRFNTLALRDPHVFVDFIVCNDVTDTKLAGFSVNDAIKTAITTDGSDADALLDLSPTLVFRPLKQGNGASTSLDVYFADCTSPLATTSCKPGALAPESVTSTAATAGTCMQPIAGTTHGYSPTIANATAPCFSSSSTTVTLMLAGIPITLHDARVAATFSGSPASQVVNGLLEGFISETDANNTILPASLPLVGGKPLSTLLAGGSGACPSYSDKDTDNGVVGWWFYLNFTAPTVPWSDN